MVKFQYSLQNILNIKEKMEEQKKMALSDANQHLRTEENRLNGLHTRRDSLNNHFRSTVSGRVTVRQLRDFNKAHDYVQTSIKNQCIVIEEASRVVEEKRIILQQALMERQMYEKLKEKAYEAYLSEANKEEQKHLDEIVSYKYRKPV